jgi:hypothetical protein
MHVNWSFIWYKLKYCNELEIYGYKAFTDKSTLAEWCLSKFSQDIRSMSENTTELAALWLTKGAL